MRAPLLDAGTWALVQAAGRVRKRNFAPLIEFARPSDTITVSVTGSRCALCCAHCEGKYLEGMISLDSYLVRGETGGEKSLLISGGCDAGGRVPLAHWAGAIKEITRSRRSVFHVGLVTPEEVPILRDTATVVSLDLVADQGVIENVFRLKGKSIQDYWDAYLLLRREGIRVVPHICLGLPGSSPEGEERVIGRLAEEGTQALVIIVFTPTPGTALEVCPPPPLERVVRSMAKARLLLPDVPILLGCMRPRGKYRGLLDRYAVLCGFNSIVNPTLAAVEVAAGLHLEAVETRECCVL